MTEAWRFLCSSRSSAQVGSIKEIVKAKPLILQVETTNLCNSRCVFCAYQKVKRKKGTMSPDLFRKVASEYNEMGGGAISLTPIMGSPLVDKYLLERIEILKEFPAINQVSMTTNAIALDSYSREDVLSILENVNFLQISMGGLSSHEYFAMFGVDKFACVSKSIERLLELRKLVDNPSAIALAFRTSDERFQAHHKRELAAFHQAGIMTSHICKYNNYAGIVTGDEKTGLVVNQLEVENQGVCAIPCISMAVCWDGTITGCGCADVNGSGLRIGNANDDDLREVWAGKNRRELMDKFEANMLPDICRRCSFFQSEEIFARACFGNIAIGRALPIDFYHQFWGG